MIFPRQRYTAPTQGPTSSLITQWFIKAIQPWLLAQLQSVQRGIPYDQLIDMRDLVDGLGSGGDDAVRWMTAHQKAPNNSTVYIPPMDYQFLTPCVFRPGSNPKTILPKKGVRLVSFTIPVPDGDVGMPRVFWGGSAGEYVFHWDRCYGCEIDGLSVEMDAGATARRAVNFDDDGPGMSSQNRLRNFRVHAQRDSDTYEMIVISENARSNHEYYQFENVQLSGGGGANGPGDGVSKGVGFKIMGKDGQSKNHRFLGLTTLNALGIGIWQTQGSFCADNISCWNNEIDIRRDGSTEAQHVKMNSERSRQTLVDTANDPFEFVGGSRFGPQWTGAGKGYFQPGAMFHLHDASIDDHIDPAMRAAGSTLFDFSKSALRATVNQVRFAQGPNTTREELGVDTMPLNRCLIWENNSNTVDIPDVWIRGGRVVVELGWDGGEVIRLIEAIGHSVSGTPHFAAFSAALEAAGARATLTPFETQTAPFTPQRP